jgi:hypothetical protein
MSLTYQRPFKLRLPEMATPSSHSDDWSWTLRAIYLCGKVQEFVFGSSVGDSEQYQWLLGDVNAWLLEQSSGFMPIFENKNTSSFPEVFLHLDCHGESS